MKQSVFDELAQIFEEEKAIDGGESPASRRIKIIAPAAREIREQLGFSQREFAEYVSLGTLRSWEQNRREPSGPAAVLLKILSISPDAALGALQS